MDIALIRALSLEEIKQTYKIYLQTQSLSHNTIQTSSVDAFYIWRKCGSDVFWNIIDSGDYETLAKDTILTVFKSNSTGNVEANVKGYLSHLRRFMRFLASESIVESSGPAQNAVRTRWKKNTLKDVPTPTRSQVEYYLEKWDTLENYHLQEVALDRLFFELCPGNSDISDVLLKSSTLNDFYSTNIFSIYPVAKHIVSLNIDERLRVGDVGLVGDIQHVSVNGTMKNFYSFATKYCSHHNPLDFPIYDSYVDEVLRYFRKKDGFSDSTDSELKDYSNFKKALIDFRDFYHLDKYNLKQIDKYLWQLGKEYFPKKYKTVIQ